MMKTYQKAAALLLALALICILLTGVLTACGSKDSGKTYDLQQVYQDILAAQPEGSDDLSDVMFETTDKDAIEEFYQGLGAIELKQEAGGLRSACCDRLLRDHAGRGSGQQGRAAHCRYFQPAHRYGGG